MTNPTNPEAAEAPKLWCDTCDGTGKVHQEHQAGCWVGGEYACPDCGGNGWYISRRYVLAAQPKASTETARPFMTREQAIAIAQRHLRAAAGKNFNRFRNPPPDWIIDAILEARGVDKGEAGETDPQPKAEPPAAQALGKCCYGGHKPKSACGSCAAWTPPVAQALRIFDEAIAAELPHVSHVEYDSHEICKHFAGEVRKRISALAAAEPWQAEKADESLERIAVLKTWLEPRLKDNEERFVLAAIAAHGSWALRLLSAPLVSGSGTAQEDA